MNRLLVFSIRCSLLFSIACTALRAHPPSPWEGRERGTSERGGSAPGRVSSNASRAQPHCANLLNTTTFTRTVASLLTLPRILLGLVVRPIQREGGDSQRETRDGQAEAGDKTNSYQGAIEPTTAPEIYGQGVRETNWRSPKEEQAGFHVPPGFSVNLFASEPMIAKPLNMAWDAEGRLWVTSTTEYPYPAEDGQGTDQVLVLEDVSGDGRADKRTVFAEGLNIPMGVLPLDNGAIVFSIPNLIRYYDDDGDLKADREEVLLGPFDTSRDTHGMVNALRRGDDGWIYACHGFNNRSTITDKNGNSVYLESGNVFRFTPDGGHVELYTRGQVNPFGMTRDKWGRWYTADCHSKPLTALLAGGCYPSFSRPHDGLGFAPEMMSHLHGSTAISGLHLYTQSQFPPAYRNRFYSGNVMTSRINCNQLSRNGATVTAVESDDFLTSNDPWFRPVDIQVGPDGSLYVADFYNKIIGHYEVPLEHPGRDRTSGRIWRVSYTGATKRPSPRQNSEGDNFRSTSDLYAKAQAENLQVSARAYRLAAHAPLFRFGDHDWSKLLQLASEQLSTSIARPSPQTIAMIEFLGVHGDANAALELLGSISRCEDETVRQAIRIAVRDLLQEDAALETVHSRLFRSETLRASLDLKTVRSDYLSILPAIGSGKATARYLNSIRASDDADAATQEQAIELATEWLGAKHGSAFEETILRDCLAIIARRYAGSVLEQARAISQLADRIHPANAKSEEFRSAHAKAVRLVDKALATELADTPPPITWKETWPEGQRQNELGREGAYRSSFQLGERFVGSTISGPFLRPNELSFEIVGHNGPPTNQDQRLNFVRLIDQAGVELVRAYPPRSDIAVRITWDLSRIAEQQVRFEAVDGDSAGAYAWLAFGNFSVPELNRSNSLRLLELLVDLSNSQVDYSENADHPSARSLYRVAASLPQKVRLQLLAGALAQDGLNVSAALVRFAASEDVNMNFESFWQAGAESTPILAPTATNVFRSVETSRHPSLSQILLTTSKGCELLATLLQEGVIGPLSLGQKPELLAPIASATQQTLNSAFAKQANFSSTVDLVRKRFDKLDWATAQNNIGETVFKTKCAVCHQLGGEGALIGPQLDGAIKRSRERLAEDIMLPNLNVDRAFRTTLLLLDDGSVVSGMLVSEGEHSLGLVNPDGKRVEIPTAQIDQRRESTSSLMPKGLVDDLTDKELASLLKYLTSLGTPGRQE